jgi:hypothetical protein
MRNSKRQNQSAKPTEQQYGDIEAQYWHKDGSPKAGAMLAPNGAPSRLNKQQWIQVRMESFKAWFGDWQNNPSNASKAVDENGEPLLLFHGTPDGSFDEFELGARSVTGQCGSKFAHWFTDDFNVAKRFAEVQQYKKAVPELTQDEFDLKWQDSFDEIKAKIISAYGDEITAPAKYDFNYIESMVCFYGKRALKKELSELIADYSKLSVNSMVEIDNPNKKVFSVFLNIRFPFIASGENTGSGLRRFSDDNGYEEDSDGSIIKQADTGNGIANEYAAFEASQIMFALQDEAQQQTDDSAISVSDDHDDSMRP